jgi:hypothetical protein
LERRVGWQPSRFLADRAEAERAYQLAERLGSINAAAADLGTIWASLSRAFTRHRLGMPAGIPRAVRQRHRRGLSGQRPVGHPVLDPCLWRSTMALPAREWSPIELYQWIRRDEEYAMG